MNNDFWRQGLSVLQEKKAQFESGLENTRYTLTKKGRTDLIEMYHRRRVNAQKQ